MPAFPSFPTVLDNKTVLGYTSRFSPLRFKLGVKHHYTPQSRFSPECKPITRPPVSAAIFLFRTFRNVFDYDPTRF